MALVKTPSGTLQANAFWKLLRSCTRSSESRPSSTSVCAGSHALSRAWTNASTRARVLAAAAAAPRPRRCRCPRPCGGGGGRRVDGRALRAGRVGGGRRQAAHEAVEERMVGPWGAPPLNLRHRKLEAAAERQRRRRRRRRRVGGRRRGRRLVGEGAQRLRDARDRRHTRHRDLTRRERELMRYRPSCAMPTSPHGPKLTANTRGGGGAPASAAAGAPKVAAESRRPLAAQ